MAGNGVRTVRESRGSANSPRSMTAERASIMSRTRGNKRAADAAAQRSGEVDEDALRPLVVDVRAHERVPGGVTEEARRGRAEEPEGGQPHRGDGAVEALGNAETEVDAQLPGPGSRLRRVLAPRPLGDREQRGDGPGLRQPQAAGGVDRPLRVLRRAVVGLDPVPEGGQRPHLRIVDAEAVLAAGPLHVPGAASGERPHLEPLVARAPLEDRAGLGVDHEVVRVHRSRDHGLAEARAGVDDGLAAAAGDGVGGEEDARHLGLDHLLDHDREADGAVVDAVRVPVDDGPLRPERRPAAAHGVDHRVPAHDVEVGVLLAGEAGGGKVLRGRRGAHRHRRLLADADVGIADAAGDLRGDRRLPQRLARGGGGPLERVALRRGQLVEADGHGGRHLPVGLGGHAGAGRDGEARADQLAEVGGLAAHHGQERRVHFREVEDETLHGGRLSPEVPRRNAGRPRARPAPRPSPGRAPSPPPRAGPRRRARSRR